ncbi:MAG: LysR substrate-binding domain-containing protein [Pseudomonadota bacterium]|uniref:LysR substrate-binding domain-containing protein n=1 Tax=Sphingomonas sp. ERG5 TaxID=1381597 RepID=UPI00054BCD92|nr:LysR substrate-binding domain-containing protein [Sphingomonas sp. ERG5]
MRIPALNGLRAFDVVARHLSMKHAAEELCVTPSAVSQQLRGLEDDLGVALFRRANRAIYLTDAGQSLLPGVRQAFRLMVEAADRVRSGAESGILTISVTPFFAETWLVPRLADFQERHPAIDLRVMATTGLANLAAGEAEIAIRHGLGKYRDMVSDLLVAPAVVPVASPNLVARLGSPAGAVDLLDWPKVHGTDRGGWALWFEHHELSCPGAARGASFDDVGLLRTAILSGHGAGLLPAALAEPDIRDGRLVGLADAVLLDGLAYHLVTPIATTLRPAIMAFRHWALGQIVASSAGDDVTG